MAFSDGSTKVYLIYNQNHFKSRQIANEKNMSAISFGREEGESKRKGDVFRTRFENEQKRSFRLDIPLVIILLSMPGVFVGDYKSFFFCWRVLHVEARFDFYFILFFFEWKGDVFSDIFVF